MMTPDVFTRRAFFTRVFGLFTGAGLAGCGRGQSRIDTDTLEAVLDTFIPADEDPGAVQAGVSDRILERIGNDPVGLKRYRGLLAWVAKQSRETYQRPFDRLSLQQRDRLLKELYYSSGAELAQVRIDLHVVLRDCFHAFYSSPVARQVIGYHPPIEGGYPDYATPPEPIPWWRTSSTSSSPAPAAASLPWL